MQRVMIVGGPGSGKSTLARALGARTGLPVFHMDRIHWMPGWVARPLAEKIPLAHAVEAQERWIFEGGLSSTYGNRVARADTLIWLDLPVGLRFWRVLRRTVTGFSQQRPDLPESCPETFNRETLLFWRYIWRTRATARRPLLAIAAAPPPGLALIQLRTPAEVRDFLRQVPPG
jgi:adenylate kinase family enzyme